MIDEKGRIANTHKKHADETNQRRLKFSKTLIKISPFKFAFKMRLMR